MPSFHENIKFGSVYKGSIKIGRIYKGSTMVYQSAFDITYIVDSTSYVEKVAPKKSILSPTSFTPTKSGWTFVGWRRDTTASASVLSTATASEDTTLYAVFKQNVTCTFKSYNKSQNVTGSRYYNSGNTVNASITVPTGAARSEWTWRGWAAAGVSTSDASVTHKNGDTISGLTSNKTYGGLYSQNYSQTTSWKCGHCGTVIQGTSKPSSCTNPVCGSNTAGQSWHGNTSTTKTRYYNAYNE